MYIGTFFLGGYPTFSRAVVDGIGSGLRSCRGVNWIWPWWWACSLALCARGWITSHAPLSEQATFITALLLTKLVRMCTSL